VRAHRLADADADAPREDAIVVLHGASWADFQRHLELRGDRASPRYAFLEGELQIMSPSRPHESYKSRIGRLVETYCLVKGIEFSPYGSWTLEDADAQRGAEPDECYVFGEVAEPRRPDLAIEVVWTSGGLDKRDIYRKLGVRELWFWQRGRLTVHALRGERYDEVASSELLPGIDLVELCSFLDLPTASQAMRAYRAALEARG
jgi:Uma2 family endonuclease